jgi:orotidine-5'-phosphate decarboxylase
MHKRIIVALDVNTQDQLVQLTKELAGRVGLFKVGKELFTSIGPRAVELVHEQGGRVFLDLKYHDIPNTVARAVKAAARLKVAMLTVHASGGKAMLAAAAEAARDSTHAPKVIAVTVLTSLLQEDLDELGLQDTTAEVVRRFGELAISSGVDGLVASPKEVTMLRKQLGQDPILVTPGVRPLGAEAQDQKRIATPSQAVSDGADYLVIGRPITAAADPVQAVEDIVAGLEKGL